MKNILGLAKYFTAQPIFGLSNTICIVFGIAVLLAVCIFLASVFGQLIKKNETDFEKPVLIFVSLFFACPATLPFLFDTNSLSGTQMLYPFALFLLAVYLIGKPVVKWLVPIICALYFIPALYYPSMSFFTALRKGAILYVPLILLFLFLDMSKKYIVPKNAQKESKNVIFTWDHSVLFIISLLVSGGSYIYNNLAKGYFSFGESFYHTSQHIDGYLFACLLITSPVLFTVSATIYRSVKISFPKWVFDCFWIAQILLFPLFKNNYYGLWIPFLVISLSSFVFYGIWQKSSAMLSAARTIGNFFSERKLLFYFFLITMASLANTYSHNNGPYLSTIFRNIFYNVPF